MSLSNLDPVLVYTLGGAVLFFIFMAFFATGGTNQLSNDDIRRYTSTTEIKTKLITQLIEWINNQPSDITGLTRELGITEEQLRAVLMGRADRLSVDFLIDTLKKAGHKIDICIE